MTPSASTMPLADDRQIEVVAEQRFQHRRQARYRRTDQSLRILSVIQWFGCSIAALLVAPHTWLGLEPNWLVSIGLPIVLGGLLVTGAFWLHPGRGLSRYYLAALQIYWSALLIHLCGGRTEAHFHLFGSMALLALYRDRQVLIFAAAITILDHLGRGYLYPESIFGIEQVSLARPIEHCVWVLFEVTFLLRAIDETVKNMRSIAVHQASLEAANRHMESEVEQRTRDLKRSHDSIRSGQERLALALEATSDGVWDWHIPRDHVHFSPSWVRALGYEPDSLEPRFESWQSLIHPADLPQVQEKLLTHLEGDSPLFAIDSRMRTESGRYRWYRTRAKVVARDDEGSPLRMVGADRDIHLLKTQEQALKRARQFLQDTLDSVREHIAILDEQGVILAVNKAWREFAVTCDDALELSRVGESYLDACAQRKQTMNLAVEEIRAKIAEMIAGKRDQFEFEYHCRSRNQRRWFVGRVTSFHEDGHARLVVSHQDVTHLKQAELRIRDLARFPAENTNPVLRFSPDGVLLYANASSRPLLELWNCREHERISSPFLEILQQSYEAGHEDNLNIPCNNRVFEITLNPILESGYVNVYGQDISERVRAEHELVEARDAADSANRAKSQFLANMSHEIRTPMTAILGFTDILLATLSDSEQREAANTIRRNGEHLLEIINDILDLSKIDSGKLEVELLEVSPCQIINDVASLMRVRAMEKGIQLNVRYEGPIPEIIHTDPTRLRQILFNLVGNAIKFTEQGEVTIAARMRDFDPGFDPGDLEVSQSTQGGQSERRTDPQLCIEVMDTGIGLTDEQQSRLFQPFSQADNSTTRRFGGTGLGLAICKRLSERLGGDIQVTSVAQRGSTFSLLIATGPLDSARMLSYPTEASLEPLATHVELGTVESSAARSSSDPHPETVCQTMPPLHGCRILLAEDGPDNQRLIKYVLSKAGADVTLVDNGQDAFLRAMEHLRRQTPFEVVLMDMQMPVLDGYEATRRLRDSGYRLPVIALTAHAMQGDRETCLQAGCDDYATKPIQRESLIQLIQSYRMLGPSEDTAPGEGAQPPQAMQQADRR